jgi:hypothetical protein
MVANHKPPADSLATTVPEAPVSAASALQHIREGAFDLISFMEQLPLDVTLGGNIEDHLTRTLLHVVEICETREYELAAKAGAK